MQRWAQGNPGMLQSMGSQRVGYDSVSQLNQSTSYKWDYTVYILFLIFPHVSNIIQYLFLPVLIHLTSSSFIHVVAYVGISFFKSLNSIPLYVYTEFSLSVFLSVEN